MKKYVNVKTKVLLDYWASFIDEINFRIILQNYSTGLNPNAQQFGS